MYRFEKYGTLRWFNGIPVYAGDKLITKSHFVWWWPINWVMTIIILPKAIYSALTNHKGEINNE